MNYWYDDDVGEIEPVKSEFSEMAGDHTVLWQFMQKVNALPEDTTRDYRLRLTFRGKAHTARMRVVKTYGNNLYIYINEKECIYLIYNEGAEEPFMSQIHADTPARRCFEPAPDRSAFTMADLLMVLLTKLMVAISKYVARDENTYGRDQQSVTITDMARSHTDHVAITPFKIARGGDGIYERYGYYSEALIEIKEAIQHAQIRNLSRSLQAEIKSVVGREVRGDEAVTSVMAEISREEDYGISDRIVRFFGGGGRSSRYDDEEEAFDGTFHMTLDETSPQWAAWDAEMQIVGIGRWGPRHQRTIRRIKARSSRKRSVAAKAARKTWH
jgi:hypothetical protein